MPKSLEELLDTQSDVKTSAADQPGTEPTPEIQEAPVVEAAPAEPDVKQTPPETVASEPGPADKTSKTTGDKNDGPPPSVSKDDDDADPRIKAFKAKAVDEARKRQDYEKQVKERDEENAALKKQLQDHEEAMRRFRAQQQPQPQQPPRQPARPPQVRLPDPDVDPGGAVRALSQTFQTELQRRDQQLSEMLWQQNVVTSQRYARGRYEDYDAVEEVFADEMGKNPALRAQLRQAEDPAEFAYQMGRKLSALREMGDDPIAYRERERQRIEQEVREKLEAEYAERTAPAPTTPQRSAAPAPRPAPAPAPPKSLAGVPSSAPRSPTRHAFNGPTPLEKILG
jgi:hypothetical protein